jgi:hypothetical protein
VKIVLLAGERWEHWNVEKAHGTDDRGECPVVDARRRRDVVRLVRVGPPHLADLLTMAHMSGEVPLVSDLFEIGLQFAPSRVGA